MPCQSRTDAPGALHHNIAHGVGRRHIFNDDQDRDNFVDRLKTFLNRQKRAAMRGRLSLTSLMLPTF